MCTGLFISIMDEARKCRRHYHSTHPVHTYGDVLRISNASSSMTLLNALPNAQTLRMNIILPPRRIIA
ncbi:hypothetical protein XFEB_00016 [Xylella fastidiosa EB92.1]|nr:hypothetical protein XFEB_00016 [Xylella fastidiosa EB92.1]